MFGNWWFYFKDVFLITYYIGIIHWMSILITHVWIGHIIIFSIVLYLHHVFKDSNCFLIMFHNNIHQCNTKFNSILYIINKYRHTRPQSYNIRELTATVCHPVITEVMVIVWLFYKLRTRIPVQIAIPY